jgi:hypothetical protein
MYIVSAYYKVPNKVHKTHLNQDIPDIHTKVTSESHGFYIPHLVRFFKYIQTPVIFFTDEEMYAELKPLAGPNVKFVIQPFDMLRVFESYPQSFWERQRERDTEAYHTWQLGAIWANKKYFVQQAAEETPNEDWFVWMDAGCIRTDEWEPYLEDFTQRPFFKRIPGVYCQALASLPSLIDVCRYEHGNVIAGALIVFHRNFIQTYIDDYNECLNEYDKLGVSATSDQLVMCTTAVRYSAYIYCIERGKFWTPDEWFFFLALI